MRGSKYLLPLSFFAMICLPSAAKLAGVSTPPTLGENRSLADFPSWEDGVEPAKFIGLIESYINDNFGFRDNLVWANAYLRSAIFGEPSSNRVFFGQNGWWFLLEARLWAYREACGINPYPRRVVDQIRDAIAKTVESANTRQIALRYMVIPRKEEVYIERLPLYLQKPCRTSVHAVEQVKSGTNATVAAAVLDPRDLFSEASQTYTLYGPTRFHWYDGDYATIVAADMALRSYGIEPRRVLTHTKTALDSDLQHLVIATPSDFIGDTFSDSAVRTDVCHPKDCLPGLTDLHPTGGYSTYWPALSGVSSSKLLLITDSFGPFVAPLFTPYFDSVLQVSLNALNGDEAKKVQGWLMEKYEPTHMLMLIQTSNLKNVPSIYSLPR